MEEKSSGVITAFDSLFTTDSIRMLKVLLTRLPSPQQKGFAVYIKFMELQYTLSILHTRREIPLFNNKPLNMDFFSGDNTDTIELLDELLPFSTSGDRTRIENIKNMLQGMSRMKEMMEMMDMVKEMFPDGFGSAGDNPMDFFSGMAGMSDMDMSSVFDMFGKDE